MAYSIQNESFESLDALWRGQGKALSWPNVFGLPAWMKTWWQNFAENKELNLVSIRNDQELLGIAVAFRDIREELINNRVDAKDRQKEIKELIADPIQSVADIMFPEMERRSVLLEKVLLD